LYLATDTEAKFSIKLTFSEVSGSAGFRLPPEWQTKNNSDFLRDCHDLLENNLNLFKLNIFPSFFLLSEQKLNFQFLPI